MAPRSVAPDRETERSAPFDGAFRLVAVLGLVLVALIVVRLVADAGRPTGDHAGAASAAGRASADPTDPGARVDVASYLTPDVRSAPGLALTGPNGQGVSLAGLRGVPVLVFFGFTHCADVCPATIGTVGEAIDAYGQGARAIFVSIDPERDTVPWLAEFVRFMPAGFTAVTGTPERIRSVADDWGVRYAREDGDTPGDYEMSHTADVFLVDPAGRLRAKFPFGTDANAMTAVLRSVAATTAAPTTLTPSEAPSDSPSVVDLWPRVVSSSVWAGGSSPVILALYDGAGTRLDDPSLRVTVQPLDSSGNPTGPVVPATTVQPIGVREVSFVPILDLPTAGLVRLAVEAIGVDGATHFGIAETTALDPGGTAPLGATAPTVRTPTGADFGGDLIWVTTDPLPEPRLSRTSTVDALAAGTPFVLVVDSYRFKVTPACGRAVVMAKALVDRWTTVPFIHLEPYRYSVVTSEPVLDGSFAAPHLTDPAEAWGVGAAPWGIGSMPWMFVVDQHGVIRAKYQGVIGSADVDVILTLLSRED